MTKRKNPKLRLHKPSGRAVVTLSDTETNRRRDFYLGDYGSPEAHAAYAELIADWRARRCRLDLTPQKPSAFVQPAAPGDSVAKLCLDYAKHLEERGGVKPEQIAEVKRAIRYARTAEHEGVPCGALSVSEFGPKALQSVRQAMIQTRKKNGEAWKRKTINERVAYIIKMFKWAVANERAPKELPAALACVEPLKRGEFGVPEGKKGKPVPIAHVNAIREYVSPVLWAMIQVQMRMVARAGEVCMMRPIDLDMSGTIWLYRPVSHKTERHGHGLVKYINPDCQAFIQPLLAGRPVEAFLFNPAESYAAWRLEGATAPRRDTQPDTPRATGRTIGEHYITSSYGKAIERACIAAGVPKWTTHQLRHTGYSEARKQVGVEKALLLLGDVSTRMADVYGEKSQELAISAAAELRITDAA